MPPESSTAAPAGSSSRLALDVRHLPWMRALAGDYAYAFDKVSSLYAGDPRSGDAWRDVAARVQAQQKDRHRVADALLAQQAHRGAPDAARAAAARLRDPRTIAVVTGQQAGAFGGPLFTALKAVTALKLASQAAASLDVPVVTVFWADVEDHDWQEVASCTVLDPENEPRTVTIPAPEGAGELPVARLILEDGVSATLDELEGALAPTEFTEWVMRSLRDAYRPGSGMADAFCKWLESVLGAQGLIVFDSSDRNVKPLLSELFGKEVAAPGRTAALAAEAGETLRSLGHPPQVVPQPESVALFKVDGHRKAIRHQSGRFLVGDESVAPDALARDASSGPEHFSPNVLLRPVVQDTLFPTACYVAGPSELAYLAQLRQVYAQFGVPMPLIYPRATATLVDSATNRFLSKYDVAVPDLQPQDESALNRMLESQLPATVDAAIKEADETIRRAMERVIEAVPAVDPTLAGAAKTTLGKMEHEVRALQGKVIQAAKRRDETLRRQFTRARAQMFPAGKPQERVLGCVHFLNLYGPALVDRLLEELPLDLGKHWVLTI